MGIRTKENLAQLDVSYSTSMDSANNLASPIMQGSENDTNFFQDGCLRLEWKA